MFVFVQPIVKDSEILKINYYQNNYKGKQQITFEKLWLSYDLMIIKIVPN